MNKKSNKDTDLFLNEKNKHLYRVMKLTCLSLFLCLGAVLANTAHGQQAKVSINFGTTTTGKLLDEIEKQTDYLFVYNQNEVDVDRSVHIEVNETQVAKVLSQAFEDTDIVYAMEGSSIMLMKKNIKSTDVTQQLTKNIKGVVLDVNGETIIGANVIVKGTTIGVMTDFDGNFELSKIPNNAILVISYLGYARQEISVSGKTKFDIVLHEDSQSLSEVVVVGFGTQKKANLTGSVSAVSSEELNSRPITNVSSGLQGLMPGVTVTSGQGRPGQDNGTIRVRGIGTLNSASPYILIDGVESGSMNSLDPNDIESITVLKDAASAAIYGSKASNGVILITTKRGKEGPAKISYTGYVGFQNPTGIVDRLNSADYATLYNQTLTDQGKASRFTEGDIETFRNGSDPFNYSNTDWSDLAYQTGIQHQHNVNVSGGSKDVKFMASVGYLNQTGILPNATRGQFNGRTNLDVKLSEKLNMRINLAYINNAYSDPNTSYAGGSSDQTIRQINRISPWIPYKNEDGTYGSVSDGNPIAWLDLGHTVDRSNQNFAGTLSADYEIIKGLKATATASYISDSQHYKAFMMDIQYNPSTYHGPNELKETFYNWNRTNFDALLNYDKAFGKHSLKAMAGFHLEKYNYRENTMFRKNFPNNDLTDINAGAAGTQTNGGFTRELAMISYFGRVNYDYAGKYLFEANIRSDASSRFAPEHRWGYFPSLSAAWRMTEEGFMENTRDWLNNLKVRGSWGLLGNQEALSDNHSRSDYYPWMNTYSLGANYPFGGSLTSGFYQENYNLATITWEKSRTWGIGLDATFLNKFNLTLDYYDRLTTDIIMDVPVPSEFALGPYKDNVGEMSNRGLEISLGYSNTWNDWSFSAVGNFAYNKNELLNLGGVDRMIDGLGIKQVGSAINSYFVYEVDGFFQSNEEAQAYMDKYKSQGGYPFSRDFKAGDLRYVDTNGDGKMTAEDRTVGDSKDPSYTFGANLSVGYKGFDLSAVLTGAAGVSRYFSHELYGAFEGDVGHPSTLWLDAWTPENTNASMPRIHEGTNSPSNASTVNSEFWVQNTSYLRLKNVQLGYTFPSQWMKSAGLSNLRVYYSAENILTFDSLPLSVDPESPDGRGSHYPLIQTHSFGVNLTF